MSETHPVLLSALAGFVCALIFAIGIAIVWPTMMGFVAERTPKTGALGMAIIGGAGMLSVSIVLPLIGHWYDNGIALRTPAGTTPNASQLADIQAAAGLHALGNVAVLPAALTVIFILIAVLKKKPAAAAAH